MVGQSIIILMMHATLFIKGELSNYIESHNIKSIETLFPNSEVKSIEGTGHWLHAEKPKSFNRLVIEFFAE